MNDVSDWLESIGMGEHVEAFARGAIDWAVIPELDHEVLKELGVSTPGHRLRILKAAKSLGGQEAVRGAVAVGTGDRLGAASSAVERRQLTVMFCDLVDSVGLAGRMDIEDYRDLLGRFREAVVAAVESHGGFVARHQGDGVLVYFGYPRAHEDDAARSLRAGLAVVRDVGAIEHAHDVELAVRIGVATGPAVVGDVLSTGASSRSELAALGTTPNLAARLQGEAAPSEVLISQTTVRLTAGGFELLSLGSRELKGFAEAVPIHRVLRERTGLLRFSSRAGENLSPFVGREDELDLIARRWKRVLDGRGQAVLAVGEAGIGKSRLCQVALAGFELDPAQVFPAQCSPNHGGTPLYPFSVAIESRARDLDPHSAPVGRLRRHLDGLGFGEGAVLGHLASLMSIELDGEAGRTSSDSEASAPAKRREEYLSALTEYIVRCGEIGPSVVLVEDLHWADPTTHEFLGRLVATIESKPVLILITTRPELDVPWSDAPNATMVSLSRLDAGSAGVLLHRAASSSVGIKDEVASNILSRANGNPLYIEELTRALVTAGDVETVPATLQDSLMARLDATDEGKLVAQLAAVIGHRFDEAALRELWDGEPERLAVGLSRLCEDGLVSRGLAERGDHYAFKHALIRDAAYEGMLRAERRAIHRRLADYLAREREDIAARQPELIATHYLEARSFARASAYWFEAGQLALRKGALTESERHLEKSLEILRREPASDARLQEELHILVDRASVAMLAHGQASKVAEEVLTHARSLCERLPDPPQLGAVLRGLTAVYMNRGEADRPLELAQECLAFAERHDLDELRLAAYSALILLRANLGDAIGAHRDIARALNIDHTQAGLRERDAAYLSSMGRRGVNIAVFVRTNAARVLWTLGYVDEALRRSQEAYALGMGHPWSRTAGAANLCVVHKLRREPEEALRWSKEAERLATKYGYPSWLSMAQVIQGWALASLGEVEQGWTKASQGVSVVGEIHGAMKIVPWRVLVSAEIQLMRDRPEDAFALAEQTLEVVVRTGTRGLYVQTCLIRARALTRCFPARRDEAEAGLRQALAFAREQQTKSYELQCAIELARLWRERGDGDHASALLGSVLEWFDEGRTLADWREGEALRQALASRTAEP